MGDSIGVSEEIPWESQLVREVPEFPWKLPVVIPMIIPVGLHPVGILARITVGILWWAKSATTCLLWIGECQSGTDCFCCGLDGVKTRPGSVGAGPKIPHGEVQYQQLIYLLWVYDWN